LERKVRSNGSDGGKGRREEKKGEEEKGDLTRWCFRGPYFRFAGSAACRASAVGTARYS